jgi:hypothetical protein
VRNTLGDLDRILRKDETAFRGLTNIDFTPADGFLAAQIDGRTSARDVFKLIPLPAESVERSLFSLLCTGVVDYQAPVARVSPPVRTPPPPAAPVETLPPPPRPVVAKPPHPTAGSGAGRDLERERQRVDATGRTIEETRRMILDAYEALDRKDFFELLDIPRTANDVQVKEAYFRLVKSFHPDTRSDPALADVEPMGEAVFLKLSEAYEKLRTRTSRQDYAASLPVRVVRSTETVPPPSQTPPGILGIGEEMEAQTETAHVSWLALQSLRMAESSFRAGQFGQCIRYAEAALPNLEGHDAMRAKIVRARALAKNTKWVKEAERAIQEVVREHPNAHEAYAALGDIYRASQMTSRAVHMYRKALELDPKNHHARTALTEIEGPDPGPGGLLKKLFKKN